MLERLEHASLQIDAHDAEHLVARAHRKVEALRLWQGVSARPGVLVVVESPRCYGAFVIFRCPMTDTLREFATMAKQMNSGSPSRSPSAG